MATYFDGNTEMQGNGDALQTLFLMNPAHVGYSDNLQQRSSATDFVFHGGGSIPGFHYNPLINSGEAREVTRDKQGLFLSLSPQQGEFRVSGNVVLSCKYLKVAQQLLDEVVSIGKEVTNGRNGQPKNAAESSEAGDGGAQRGAELTTAEKQDIQMKKVKLVDMLNEVEQRYKQYKQQMQMVIRWFEEAAGGGSAKAYTALALQTISKQFRCLKDAITAQIQTAGKRSGEDKSCLGGSKLKYMDVEIRQQRAVQQQFGMIQNNAWRSQRGLPERSVSVLRAWLFKHFLHPYPKDTDKIMLAKQAGLTRSQVSNWFINARVRLWKPMVEEMYDEEMKARSSQEDDKQVSTSQQIHNNNAGLFNLIRSSETERMIMLQEPSDQIPMKYGYEWIPYSSDGVSLTLGLHHCENGSSEPQQDGDTDCGSFNYDANIQVQNTKRFAAQLMPDFVT